MNSTAKQLREKAAICRKNAAGKTGEAHHRELQKAYAYEEQAKERENSFIAEDK